jgi:short-subunit dehydrogenase
MYPSSSSGISRQVIFRKSALSAPRDVAAHAYRALVAGQVVVVPGLSNQMTAAWAQVTPRWVTRYLAGIATRQAR